MRSVDGALRTARRRATVTVESPYLLEPEAAAYLRVAAQTLANWRSDGLQVGPRFRAHGGVIVYAVDDLEQWSEARAALSTMEARQKSGREGVSGA